MATTRWDPLRDLLVLQEQIGQLVGADAPGWNPPVDLCETVTAFVLTAEVPGLTRDRIDIHAEARRITIRGHRSPGPVPFERCHRVERGHGGFQRAFPLAKNIDVDAVTATLVDGVLTVTMPKRGAQTVPVTE